MALPIDVIVSDDSAQACEPKNLHLNESYTHQSPRLGAFPNMRWVMLQAKTPYVVYCADDDYLLEHELRQAITFLDRHPEVVAYYAPCQLWDEVNQEAAWNAFYVASDETFTDPGKLWNFLIHNHVWPEHAIYRTSHLPRIMRPRIKAYWAFLDLANALAEGPVHFASKPYYRNITNHPLGWRSKLGDEQCLTHFDEYRAGLENLAFDLFANHLNPELKAKLNVMIGHFINMRLGVAHRLHVMNGRQDEALSIEKRLRICA